MAPSPSGIGPPLSSSGRGLGGPAFWADQQNLHRASPERVSTKSQIQKVTRRLKFGCLKAIETASLHSYSGIDNLQPSCVKRCPRRDQTAVCPLFNLSIAIFRKEVAQHAGFLSLQAIKLQSSSLGHFSWTWNAVVPKLCHWLPWN